MQSQFSTSHDEEAPTAPPLPHRFFLQEHADGEQKKKKSEALDGKS